MMYQHLKTQAKNCALALTVSLAVGMTACSSGGSDSTPVDSGLSLDLQLPDSLTGGQLKTQALSLKSVSTRSTYLASSEGSSVPCSYYGANEQDPFRNGYEVTKLMVSVVATWTCIADVIIDLASGLPQDGTIVQSDNDLNAPDYDPEDATHYSVSSDSEMQTTVRLYYNYDRELPPTQADQEDIFLSWAEAENGDVQGVLIINGRNINVENRKPDDPVDMRMNFEFNSVSKVADMFLRFETDHQYASGFRIHVHKDLTANYQEQVYTARGLVDMKTQFLPVEGITETPKIRLYTVSDRVGNGAALAEMEDVGLPLELNAESENHLGHYLFDKRDIYFFDDNQTSDKPWDWISKTFTYAVYRGGRTTPPSDGDITTSFDPSLDQVQEILQLPVGYFEGGSCAKIGDGCLELMDAIFQDGFAEQEPNQGADPGDWRSSALTLPDYLKSVYPNGSNWDGAFDMVFTPGL